jgi:hypothetical protein
MLTRPAVTLLRRIINSSPYGPRVLDSAKEPQQKTIVSAFSHIEKHFLLTVGSAASAISFRCRFFYAKSS